METERRLEPELLEAPASYRLKHFKNYTMGHPLLKESYAKLMNAIHEPAGTMMIFVVGPAGVGKTTLLQRVEQSLIKELLPILAKEPGRVPVVNVEAIGPDFGVWSWKDFYKRLLIAFDEPLIEHKIHPDRPRSRGGAAELRYALEQTIRHRQPAAILVDEAQHIAKTASGRKLQDQLDCIKSLANMTKTVHALFGSYELLAFRNLSGQLSRRSIYIPFPRYRADQEKDVLAFKSVIRTFELNIPLKEKTALVEHWEYLYERSIGCVGVLKDWLSRALADVFNKGKESLGLKDLERHAFSVSQCQTMLSEAIHGEKELEETAGSREQLRNLLRIEMGGAAKSEKIEGNSSKSNHTPSTRNRRVGVPNPKRYPIGIEPNDR